MTTQEWCRRGDAETVRFRPVFRGGVYAREKIRFLLKGRTWKPTHYYFKRNQQRCTSSHTDCSEGYSSLQWLTSKLVSVPAPRAGVPNAAQRLHRGTVTKSPLPNNHHAVCQYCGLESATSMNHASTRGCIDALQREVTRLREHLMNGRSDDSPVSEAASSRAVSVGSARSR